MKALKKIGGTKLGDITIGQYTAFSLGLSLVCGIIGGASYLIANAIDNSY